jgi:hypothetical protein
VKAYCCDGCPKQTPVNEAADVLPDGWVRVTIVTNKKPQVVLHWCEECSVERMQKPVRAPAHAEFESAQRTLPLLEGSVPLTLVRPAGGTKP